MIVIRTILSTVFPYTTLFRSVYVGGRQQAEARVMVLGVVPGEEDVTVSPGVLDRAETSRKRRAVLERLELRSEEHTSELQSLTNIVCRLLLEKKKQKCISYN